MNVWCMIVITIYNLLVVCWHSWVVNCICTCEHRYRRLCGSAVQSTQLRAVCERHDSQ